MRRRLREGQKKTEPGKPLGEDPKMDEKKVEEKEKEDEKKDEKRLKRRKEKEGRAWEAFNLRIFT